jgi:ATP-dependent DNA helicase RecG
MHYTDRRGFGLKKITDETGRLFKDEGYNVEYYNNNGFFMVTIYNKFTENKKKVYNTILNNNYATTNDIASIIGLANRTIANIIKKLKEQNIIKGIGPDKNGHYEVK